jgi:hypothetical protein
MTTHNLIILDNENEAVRITPNGIHSGMDITIQNVGSSTVYIGGEEVTTSNYGFKLTAGSAFSVELPGSNALYVVSESDTASVATLSFNLEG